MAATLKPDSNSAPGAHLAAGVSVGCGSWVGIGAVLREGVHVGSDLSGGRDRKRTAPLQIVSPRPGTGVADANPINLNSRSSSDLVSSWRARPFVGRRPPPVAQVGRLCRL